MGCDIHFFAEFRKDASSPWQFLPAPPTGVSWEKARESGYKGGPSYRYGEQDTSDPYYSPGYEHHGDGTYYMRDWFDDRNYRLFGMLADVRNGRGFAGCDMGDPVEPILPPPHARGWPDDCCEELQAERERIEHTPSWLTVKEMQSYFDRKRVDPIVIRGVVSGKVYEDLRDIGNLPSEWCGGISGKGVLVVHPGIYDIIDPTKLKHTREATTVDATDLPEGVMNSERESIRLARSIGGLKIDSKVRMYVRAQWAITLDRVTHDFEDCLREMVAAAGVEQENVRAVFYFDS